MLGLFKAIVGVVTLPIDLVADVVSEVATLETIHGEASFPH